MDMAGFDGKRKHGSRVRYAGSCCRKTTASLSVMPDYLAFA